jgi:hypothetical protein
MLGFDFYNDSSKTQILFIILKVYGRLNKYAICLEKTMKYDVQDEIGTHFMEKVVEEVKAGNTFSFVMDNIDWEEKVHDM